MRFYPRNAQSRRDALAGKGHIGQHSQPSLAENLDRLKRYDPAVSSANVAQAYGGTKDPIG
jgi:hypothetical protein